MNPKPPPPRASDASDFAEEHAEPASRPITPSPTTPLEGLDPDRDGWGASREKPPLWQQLKDFFRRKQH